MDYRGLKNKELIEMLRERGLYMSKGVKKEYVDRLEQDDLRIPQTISSGRDADNGGLHAPAYEAPTSEAPAYQPHFAPPFTTQAFPAAQHPAYGGLTIPGHSAIRAYQTGDNAAFNGPAPARDVEDPFADLGHGDGRGSGRFLSTLQRSGDDQHGPRQAPDDQFHPQQSWFKENLEKYRGMDEQELKAVLEDNYTSNSYKDEIEQKRANVNATYSLQARAAINQKTAEYAKAHRIVQNADQAYKHTINMAEQEKARGLDIADEDDSGRLRMESIFQPAFVALKEKQRNGDPAIHPDEFSPNYLQHQRGQNVNAVQSAFQGSSPPVYASTEFPGKRKTSDAYGSSPMSYKDKHNAKRARQDDSREYTKQDHDC